MVDVKMVRRKPSIVLSETATYTEEDERSVTMSKGGVSNFFTAWFSSPTRTETRDDDDGDDTGDDYSRYDDDDDDTFTEDNIGGKTRMSQSFQSDGEYTEEEGEEDEEEEEEDSLIEFDRELRSRHGQACKYMRSGKFTKALKKFESILASILERFGDSHHRVGAALHNVGIANLRAGKLDDAMDAIEEAVRIRKATLGPQDPKVADSLVELGIVLLSLKEYSDSLEIFMEALQMREMEAEDVILPEMIRDSNLKIAKVLNNVGCVNYENGEFIAAKEAFVKAVDMQKKALGDASIFSFNSNPSAKPGFLTMASTMCNKGYIDLEQLQWSPAIGTFNDSLKIQKLLLGSDNKLVLSTLDNLGFSYTMNKQYDKALSTYKELMSSQEKSYGETQDSCADTLRKIIYVQIIMTDFESALQSLCSLEDLQAVSKTKPGKEVQETRKLMGQVNYQVMKYPGCSFIGQMACADDLSDEETINLDYWFPSKPLNGSKMSGHRVTCA